MSAYKKNYASWSKSNLNPSTYSGSSSSKIETSLKYGPLYSRPTSDTKASSERSSALRLGQKYGHYCDAGASRDSDKYSGTVTARLKDTEKKETTQPPVSYRSISRTGTRSRDPSVERENTERMSTLGIHNCNTTLYPSSIQSRAASHDRSEASTPNSTIPKYTGRSSITKNDKYGLVRTPRNESKEDLTTIKLKSLSKATSREDLDCGSKKYITSRFLPKNTIEKSNTAYIRPGSSRISSSQRDTSRKNREILNLLSAQSDSSKSSRPSSRCSNISDNVPKDSVTVSSTSISSKTATSTTQSNKTPSDANPDSTKSSRISNASATPWSSYLDLRFSSPKSTKASPSPNQSQIPKNTTNSSSSNKQPTNISTKTTSQSDSKSRISKGSPQASRRAILNKDFRKSVLNMNPENKTHCHHNGSVSPADSEPEFPLSEATDVSENLSSCVSYHKSNSSASKLPKRSSGDATDPRSARSTTRSPSIPSEGNSSSTAVTSGSEDDLKIKSSASKSDAKLHKSQLISSRSSLFTEHGDGSEKSPKPPMSPRPRIEKAEPETKSFLIRALTPITGGFKIKRQDSDSRVNWMDSSTEKDLETSKDLSNSKSHKMKEESKAEKSPKIKIMRRVDSGERAWWLDDNATPPEGVQVYPNYTNENIQSQDNHRSDHSQKYRIRHIDSGEKAWWLNSNDNVSETGNQQKPNKSDSLYKISHQASGEKAWWLQTPPKSNAHSSDTESDGDENHDIPLGDRASPEGLEMPREEEQNTYGKAKKPNSLFISKHKNIDDILGGTNLSLSPLMEQIFNYQERRHPYEECREVQPNQVKIHDSTPQRGIIHPNRLDVGVISSSSSQCDRLDDASLQLYKDGDYGSYLDLDASISEQQEEFDGFQLNKKNSIVLRTQLSVRVHSIIEKLLNSEGRELRRALFSLKQIFQEDKDLVHEFVQNDGLACLIKVGTEADQNYQNYILRALGQVMLYVDGMNGVIQHNATVQWLYSLISSKFRLVVKTALKLLLVFVEYVDSNCLLLIKAVQNADCTQGFLPWYNIMKLLKDFDSADTELLIYAMTLINKCFNGIPDQDTYYDQTDALEEQGIEGIIQRYMSKPGTDLDLLQQFQIYEAVLQYEDAEEKGIPLRNLDESVRKTLKSRKSVVGSCERRKSRRHSTGTSPLHSSLNLKKNLVLQANAEGDDESSSSQSSTGPNDIHINGNYKDNNKASEVGVTPALRRRRERAERQRSFMREQQESAAILREPDPNETNNETLNGNYVNSQHSKIPNGKLLNRTSSRKDMTPLKNAVNKLDSDENNLTKQPWILSMMCGNKSNDEENQENIDDTNENDRKMLLQLKRENTVKDLTQKLANQTIINNNFEENKINRIGDMTGLISKAKEGLAKSKSKIDVLKSPTAENVPKIEAKKSENELRWEELVNLLNKPLHLCDMDFTDLRSDDEVDVLAPAAASNGVPPPPPPFLGAILAPPPPPLNNNKINSSVPNPPVFGVNLQRISKPTESKLPIKKSKKTVKLFWKEVRDDAITAMKLKTGLIWDELAPVAVDTQKLEHLFESRAKDLITKEKQQELNKNKEIIVLDPKRSNAINIGMTKLPPPRSIKNAIIKMDATVMNREGIEKLLTMLPTEEERTKIQEAQAANPDLPLGSAEQFLLTLASISELPARLNLWAFKLDFESSEREIAEPLMDLKQGFEVLKVNKTFRGILGTLLSIGIFLNGTEVKGFQIEYLAKVPEVKDTVHKHSLLHHLCHIVMEKFPDASDLYSEIGAITRASKVDFDELALNIHRLETDCKASWDHLKLIVKHDGSMKGRMSEFLTDCAQRIILLGIVHRRVINRFHRFLLWLGIPLHQIADTKPNEFCRVVSEFALEYRTTRERVLQQLEKKANHRERNKTRGKMITEIGKFRTKEDRADAELRQLLGSDMSEAENLQGTFTWRRRSRDTNRSFLSQGNGNLTDGDDEILESLVKTATKGPSRTAPRERKRTRHADRKSLKRSRTRENNPFGSRDSP